MKKRLLTFGMLVFSFCVFSQKETNSAVSLWINDHPDVIFIEENNLGNFSSEELAKFSGKYIVFREEILEQDILKYDPHFLDKTAQNKEELSSKKTEADQIKEWLGRYPHVKVVKQSEFLAQPIHIQREYAERKCLILQGEEITATDINNYQY